VAGGRPGAVLFACTLNAVRSPMAAGMLQHLSGGGIHVESAGVRAGMLDPFAVALMDEIGIDISNHQPRAFRDLGDATFDLIVTLSPEAHHHALELTRVMAAEVRYWPTYDATVLTGSLSRQMLAAEYRRVRNELYQRIKSEIAGQDGKELASAGSGNAGL
jgi:protein-tyrosine-phosphatase